MPGSETSGIATLFDAVAASYDSVGVDFFQPIAASLCRAMPPKPGERWWDVGCGRGAVIEQIANIIGGIGTVVGSDLSAAMIAAAQSRIDEAGWTNVSLAVDDAQSPLHAPSDVDTISSCLVLFFLPDPLAALQAWLPSLRPGGRIGVTTFGRMDPAWTRVDEVFEPFLPPALRDARTAGARGPFASDAGMAGLLSEAGYVDVRNVADAITVHFADVEQWHDFTWSTGQRAMWLAVPVEQRDAVRRQAEERLAEVAGADGSITFTQAIRHTVGNRRKE